ncbi:MAG: hypothetical protein J0L54_04465 [Chitinophagales bacterium]|nr:hypothetical protein [Chitinophagales bacterium]
MGHERVGYLPKTQKWRAIIKDIGSFSVSNNNTVTEVAVQTTKNVRSRFKYIEEDSGVFAAFKYIILLSYSSKLQNQQDYLSKHGIKLPKGFNIFDLTQSIQAYVLKNTTSKEYSTFAIQSMIDTVAQWTKANQVQQSLIFDTDSSSIETWKKAANGAGFCELSRLFFSKFTERYLKYFLEREASARLSNMYERNQFNKHLEDHISQISKHAFETSKIVQSFSAGWYNSNVKDTAPSDTKIQGFLSFAFQKLNSELLREEGFD